MKNMSRLPPADLGPNFEEYQAAAEQGDLDAQNKLAVCYATGEGTIKNQKKAFDLWKKAAEQGHSEAQSNLGRCYYCGTGVCRDSKQAAYWWKKAADQEIPAAQRNLFARELLSIC